MCLCYYKHTATTLCGARALIPRSHTNHAHSSACVYKNNNANAVFRLVVLLLAFERNINSGSKMQDIDIIFLSFRARRGRLFSFLCKQPFTPLIIITIMNKNRNASTRKPKTHKSYIVCAESVISSCDAFVWMCATN